MHSPFVMTIFGATGDLMRAKLMPALFGLFKQGSLPQDFFIFGFSRREITDQEFYELFPKLNTDPMWGDFIKHLHYQQGTFEDPAGYKELIKKLAAIDEKIGACVTRLFYLATPPDNYEIILDNLKSTKLAEGCGQGSNKWTRIVIEKPFGKNLETAIHLDKKLSDIFEEKQIFRVDHYLGKENVQNMLAFRFANGIFEPVWNNTYIDHIQVTISEKNGIGTRGKFFDGVGNLRDVAQNHLLQLVAAVTMEQPKSFMKEDVRDARAHAIQAITCIEPEKVSEHVVRGQYQSYADEKNVDLGSDTETFVAMKFFMDTPRMKNIPIYARAGKKMKEDVVEISIVFTQTCHVLFKEYGCPEIGNVITIRIQPDEGIRMRFIAKKPGSKLSLEPVEMKFSYQEGFGSRGIDAYEKILLDILNGEQILFNRTDELMSSWKFITTILHGWEKYNPKLVIYEDGSWGPREADDLIKKDGRRWI
ncbi:MAG: glucose-6-phosphate dehydrogenase [Candidatus Levybacteria bacterium]|nr:glucose-6-phosphate dehydrogenase [Candidatus Levybacteria bacterium]